MRIATIKIKGLTPYSQSKALVSEREKNETHEDFDKRIWPEHIHSDAKGNVVIPAVCLGPGMATAASYLGKGGNLAKKGNATWAENFRCGLAIATSPTIGHHKKDAVEEAVYCHSNGKRAPGPRVWRRFPIFHEWAATLEIHILDDTIPEDIFLKVLEAFGLFGGIGRFRPQNGGHLGRFTIESCKIK